MASEQSGWGLPECSRGTGPSTPGTQLSKDTLLREAACQENLGNPSTFQSGVGLLPRGQNPELPLVALNSKEHVGPLEPGSDGSVSAPPIGKRTQLSAPKGKGHLGTGKQGTAWQEALSFA